MKVVYLRSNPVDPDSRVEKEVESLLNNGYSVKIFAWDRTSNYPTTKTDKRIGATIVDIYRVGIKSEFGLGFKNNLLPLIKFQLKIIGWLFSNRKNFDVIHAADFDTGFIASIFSIIFRKKLVYDIYDFYVDSFHVPKVLKFLVKKMEFFVINRSDLTIICTEDRVFQIEGSKPKNLIIVHNSPPYIENVKKVKKTDQLPSVVYVGVLGNGRMIREISELAVKNKNFEFHIGGFGHLEEYFKDLSNKYDNIYYYGRLTYPETLNLSSKADILTAIYDPETPNHKFAAPNKFYEALMLGKPLIMANNTGMSNFVKEYDLGVTIDYNKHSLEKAIAKIISDYLIIEDFDMRGINLYLKEFNWEVMSERLINGYNSIS